jgi:ABC-type transport system involved in multi-copper enzyme maturation permease subunit
MTVVAFTPSTRAGRYGLKQVIRAEIVKLTTLRSTLWALLLTLAGMTTVTALATNSALHHSPDWYQGFDPTNQSLASLLIGVLTMGVFGVMVVTSEYSSGTIRTSLSATPRRPLLMAGKALVTGTAMLVVGVALSFVCFGLGQAILSGGGAPSAHFGQPGVLRAVLLSGVFLGLFGLLGMGIGAIIRNTAGAISAYVGVAFLLPLLLHQLAGNPAKYTPVQILSNSVSATVTNHGQLSVTLGLVLMIAYTAAALVAGAVMFMARDA